MSLEQDLLKAADELEKTASEQSTETIEKVAEVVEVAKETVSVEEAVTKVAEVTEKVASKKEIEDIQEELGIDEELAEKVASADPSLKDYIKNLNQVSVESMGDEDIREKTASEADESDPFGDFLTTPL